VLESDLPLQSSPEPEELLWASAAPSSLLLSLASSLDELSYLEEGGRHLLSRPCGLVPGVLRGGKGYPHFIYLLNFSVLEFELRAYTSSPPPALLCNEFF
jgi:hypothetical protein